LGLSEAGRRKKPDRVREVTKLKTSAVSGLKKNTVLHGESAFY
jgi:hypothetical protein